MISSVLTNLRGVRKLPIRKVFLACYPAAKQAITVELGTTGISRETLGGVTVRTCLVMSTNGGLPPNVRFNALGVAVQTWRQHNLDMAYFVGYPRTSDLQKMVRLQRHSLERTRHGIALIAYAVDNVPFV